MPSNKAVYRQEGCAWLVPCTTDASGQVTGIGTAILFDYVGNAGPTWPAPEGASGDTEYVEVTTGRGTTVQYPKQTKKVDGLTNTVKSESSASGNGHKLKWITFEWGKTMATTIPPLQGKLVVACIPIGENATSSEEGFYYLLGKVSNEISYDSGEEVASVTLEVTGASVTATTAGDTALAWAPAEIIPVGEEDGITPTPLVAGDLPKLKAGEIVVK